MAAAVQAQHLSSLDDIPLPDDFNYDDMMRLTPAATPIPGQDMEPLYRCPVSTPANFVHPSPRVRRTKPMPVSLEISLTPRSGPSKRSAGVRPPRPGAATHRTQSQRRVGNKLGLPGGGVGGGGGGSLGGARGNGTVRPTPAINNNTAGLPTTIPDRPLNSRTLDYYYVDKMEEQREAAATNTFWLRALCSQPVHEILDKYRRRSELRRTRMIWTKTYTTPGERSLLRAWERNAPRILAPTPRGYLASADGAQSLRQSHSKMESERSSVTGSPRRHQSEPFNRSRGYTSDEGDDETEDDVTPALGSVVSSDVSVSTPRYSQRQYSPQHRSPSSSNRTKGHSPERQTFPSPPLGAASIHPAQPAYDISDHFQISLPSVRESRPARERVRTPKTRATLPNAHDRRSSLRDFKPDVLPSPELAEISPRESNVSRGAMSTATTQPATPRSTTLETSLPAIGRA